MPKIEVTVKTGTSQEKIIQTAPEKYTVYLHAKPKDGEANTALIKLLAKHFHIGKSSITIERGAKSHTKLLNISL